MRIGFDNEKYLKMQSEHIRNRIGKFGNKLYLEFGGKLFDDYHASRVLPGFAPDSKLRLLKELSSQAEIVIVISAKDIEKNKIRGDLGITYDTDVLRLIQTYKDQEVLQSLNFPVRKVPSCSKTDLKSCIFRYIFIILFPDIHLIFRLSSATKVMEKMIISRQADLLLSSLLPDPEAARWQHVFPSFITSINGAFLRDMQNSRRSLYGISRLSIRLTLHTKRQLPT